MGIGNYCNCIEKDYSQVEIEKIGSIKSNTVNLKPEYNKDEDSFISPRLNNIITEKQMQEICKDKYLEAAINFSNDQIISPSSKIPIISYKEELSKDKSLLLNKNNNTNILFPSSGEVNYSNNSALNINYDGNILNKQVIHNHNSCKNMHKKYKYNNKENPLSSNSNEYNRKLKRNLSLIEKSKMGSAIHREELKLSVSSSLFVNELKELPNKKYKFICNLGTGSYASVFLAENIITKAKVAVKKINKSKEYLLIDNKITDEINILKKLEHPNILRIIEFYNTPNSYYMINEYCPYGELYDEIKKNNLSETQLSVIFRQIISGLCYLHDHQIIHRDLKLENVLIYNREKNSKTNEELLFVKIIDFGTAKLFDKNIKVNKIVGSSYYIAPEVLDKSYNEKCDMWSVGVLLYMFLVGLPPFDGNNDNEIIENVKSGQYNKENKKWISASPELKDLINNLLLYNSDNRLSGKEALRHPWFSKFDSMALFKNVPAEKAKFFIDNLLRYKFSTKFQEMVLTYIILHMYKSQETELAIKLFLYFNKSGDGKLTKSELKNGCLEFTNELNTLVFDDVFIMLDGTGKGYLQYNDFLRGCLDKKNILTDETLVYTFNFFNKENDGKLYIENIKPYFISNNVSEEVFSNIFTEIDENNDGYINFENFKKITKECYYNE